MVPNITREQLSNKKNAMLSTVYTEANLTPVQDISSSSSSHFLFPSGSEARGKEQHHSTVVIVGGICGHSIVTPAPSCRRSIYDADDPLDRFVGHQRQPSRRSKPKVSNHRCSPRHAINNSSGVDAKPDGTKPVAPPCRLSIDEADNEALD
nr:hypothetical protein Iba_chr07aCG8380 [Ipomoea batatas]